MTSAVPTWTRTRSPCSIPHREPVRIRTSAVSIQVGAHPSALTTVAPRAIARRSAPVSATAVRSPARASATSRPCTWSDRIRASGPFGRTWTRSPCASVPDQSVPVTTVPVPCRVKTRSTGSRATSTALRRLPRRAATRSVSRRASRPVPAVAEVPTRGAPAYRVSARRARTSSSTRPYHSSSTRSVLVSATTISGTPSSSTISRCSDVCGITPSSAATTRRTTSMPVAPATIVRTKSSWPGTSTTPSWSSSSPGSSAKPRSIVMPRSRSSGRRSGSTPVRARTRALLPWSMWPAVPTTTLVAPLKSLPPRHRGGGHRGSGAT